MVRLRLLMTKGMVCVLMAANMAGMGVPVQAKVAKMAKTTSANPYKHYKKAPKKVVRKFVASNGKIVKVKNIPGNPGYYQGNHSWTYSGSLETSENKITLNTLKVKHVTYHELGHALAFMYWAERVDYSAPFPDETTEWKRIYKKEKKKYRFENSKYVKSNSSEFFAQCFATYCLHKKAMKKTMPRSYRYVKKVIKKL